MSSHTVSCRRRSSLFGSAALLAGFLAVATAYGQEPALELTLSTDKELYEVGEDITFHINARNASGEAVKIQKAYVIQHSDPITQRPWEEKLRCEGHFSNDVLAAAESTDSFVTSPSKQLDAFCFYDGFAPGVYYYVAAAWLGSGEIFYSNTISIKVSEEKT